ncbi:MAG: PASTA domain-containing protein [Nitrososphaera sp.]
MPKFIGSVTNTEVQSQSPEGGDVVQKGSTVRLTMVKSQPPVTR